MGVDMDRRKTLINFHEAVTRKVLSAAAQKNAAQVFTKVRIADVLNLDGSGLERDMYSYALKAHFDFVVTDQNHLPLFAVEFDGPQHDQNDNVYTNDRKKNYICERFGLPLARVRDEHIFRKARGVDYLTWLTELFFSFRALVEAQERGDLPVDEPLDPMGFFTNPNIPGKLPLFISLEAREILRVLHRLGVLDPPEPDCLTGVGANGRTECVAVVTAADRTLLLATGSIYLRGFGVTSSEAAEEIATVSLAQIAREYTQTRQGTASPDAVRTMLAQFLHDHVVSSVSCMGADLGFSLSFESRDGRAQWRVGALGDAPEVIIQKS